MKVVKLFFHLIGEFHSSLMRVPNVVSCNTERSRCVSLCVSVGGGGEEDFSKLALARFSVLFFYSKNVFLSSSSFSFRPEQEERQRLESDQTNKTAVAMQVKTRTQTERKKGLLILSRLSNLHGRNT